MNDIPMMLGFFRFQILEQGRTSLTKLLPDTQKDFLQSLADLPEKIRGRKVYFHDVHHVTVIVETLVLQVHPTFNFDKLDDISSILNERRIGCSSTHSWIRWC